MWGDISQSLANDVAYIPIGIEKWVKLHGSKVTNYSETAASNGYPELGQIGVSS
jgi:peptide/nickel transport system substrate-binding protein